MYTYSRTEGVHVIWDGICWVTTELKGISCHSIILISLCPARPLLVLTVFYRRLTFNSRSLIRQLRDCSDQGQGEIPARLADAGIDDTLRVSFPSWRRCHGLPLRPSSSTRGNPRSDSSDRTTMALRRRCPSCRRRFVCSRRPPWWVCGCWLLRRLGSPLKLGGFAVLFACLGWAPILSALGILFTPSCVHDLCVFILFYPMYSFCFLLSMKRYASFA